MIASVRKSAYFDSDSIERVSGEMLREIEPLRSRHRLPFVPERSVLLILDLQRYFLEETSHAYVPSAKAIVPRIVRVAEAYRSRGLPIVLTRHSNSEGDNGMMPRWWRDVIRPGSPSSEIIPEVRLFGPIVEKGEYDAFYGTPLERILRERGVAQIVVCGVMTHLCCETTARSAFVRGFEVFFTIDGTASYTEAFHRAALLNLAHGFAVPVLVNEILSAFGHPASEEAVPR